MRPRVVVLGVAVALAAGPRARADTPPWAQGVTEAQKTAAHALLDAGNSLFVEHDYVAALAKYREAIAQWDHPAIRFNIVRCLIQLDRPLDADDELQRALAYGEAPLEEAVYSEALAYSKLLANEIGHVAVHCAQPGVDVSLDGHHVVSCPGTADSRVAPGAHQIVGTRDGFVAKAVSLVVIGGKHEEVDIALVPIARSGARAQVVHRWDRWKPWLVGGTGAGIAALGALIDFQASRDMTSYDRALASACADTGCGATRPIPASVAAQKINAQRESDAGVTLIGAGIAAAVTGGVLLYLNRDRTLYSAEHLDIAPQAGGGVAVTLSGRF